MYDKPNQDVAQTPKVTEQYTEVVAGDHATFPDYFMPPRLVIFDQGDNKGSEMPHVVVIARYLEEGTQFVRDYFGLSIEDQKEEMSHIDLSGNNGKYLFSYISYNASGESTIWATYALHEVGYNFVEMVDSYFVP